MQSYNPKFMELEEVLEAKNIISAQQLADIKAQQLTSGKRMVNFLVDNGYASAKNVAEALSEILDMAVATEEDLAQANSSVVKLLPKPFAEENSVIALTKSDGVVTVAMANPDDIGLEDHVKKLVGQAVQPLLASRDDIRAAILKHYKTLETSGEVDNLISDLAFFAETDEGEEEALNPEAGEEDAPIVKLVNLILAEGIKENATDIHIEPTPTHIVVRYRIDGVLHEVMTPPLTSLNGIVSRVKVLSKLNIAERRLPQDGRITVKTKDREVDIRVSILPCVTGEKIVMRLLDKSGFEYTLLNIGFEEDMLDIFKKWIHRPYGIIVVSGPTGSGKSTTLHAALKEIQSTEINISTVEDPVEYQVSGINQVQVNDKIGLTFAASLRSILRQDPDVCLLGEIRDHETADMAVKFSLTGHLVFSTVHANDAPATITRLVDMGLPPYLVGSSLNLVMAQRLVRRICENCREEYTITDQEIEMLNLDPEEAKGMTLWRGRGCSHCRNTGYKGRTAIFEILEINPAIRRLIFSNADQDLIREKALQLGMITLRESGLRKLRKGITSVQEVIKTTIEE